MPGMSVLFDVSGNVLSGEAAFSAALDSVLHSKRYAGKILFRGDGAMLGFTGCEGYPISTFSAGDFDFVLEGAIYSESRETVETELIELSDVLFQDREKGKHILREWLLKTDGEFIVFIHRKSTGEIVVFNDLLGHLPLYYLRTGDIFLISREIGIFRNFPSRVALDRMGIAQFLVFAFPLGERTLFENVRRLKPGAVLSFTPRLRDISLECLHELNFEEKQHADRPMGENVEESVALFEQACRRRTELPGTDRIVVSLSGGLDSRTVAAGLKRSGVPFEGITFMDSRGGARVDVEIACQVAEAFHIEWRKVDLPPARGADALALLTVKQGLNYLSMKFIIPFLHMIESLYGSDICHFNGNTGMILRDYRAAKKLHSVDEMIRYMLSKGGRYCMSGIFPFGEAARLAGIDEREFIGELSSVLSSYPEKSFDQKYVHSVFSGYCFNWHYEGIDMQRCFFWSHIPLESTPFFLHVMNCPDEQKRYYMFYREFIKRLSPETSEIQNANWGASVDSKKAFLKRVVRARYDRMPSAVKSAMRSLFRHPSGYSLESGILRCFREQVENCPSIGEYMEKRRLFETAGKCSRIELDTLFTITSLIEQVTRGESMLMKYGDTLME
jgi:asparagine synthase (glutamine-hydrolysing)